jgi:adenylate cyclase
MPLLEDLKNKVQTFFTEPYTTEETTIVPGTDYSKLTFGNKGLVAELAFLFVDIRQSSRMHEVYGYKTAALIYQSFHEMCVRIIIHNDGKVRAFDGDRIMGVFAGDSKCSNAAKAAMNIRWSIIHILNPKLNTPLSIGCGIEYGKTLITKVGKGRDINNQDLIWIGKACNYASHLCQVADNSILVSEEVYARLNEIRKYGGDPKRSMWDKHRVEIKGNFIWTYKSNFTWPI